VARRSPSVGETLITLVNSRPHLESFDRLYSDLPFTFFLFPHKLTFPDLLRLPYFHFFLPFGFSDTEVAAAIRCPWPPSRQWLPKRLNYLFASNLEMGLGGRRVRPQIRPTFSNNQFSFTCTGSLLANPLLSSSHHFTLTPIFFVFF